MRLFTGIHAFIPEIAMFMVYFSEFVSWDPCLLASTSINAEFMLHRQHPQDGRFYDLAHQVQLDLTLGNRMNAMALLSGMKKVVFAPMFTSGTSSKLVVYDIPN